MGELCAFCDPRNNEGVRDRRCLSFLLRASLPGVGGLGVVDSHCVQGRQGCDGGWGGQGLLPWERGAVTSRRGGCTGTTLISRSRWAPPRAAPQWGPVSQGRDGGSQARTLAREHPLALGGGVEGGFCRSEASSDGGPRRVGASEGGIWVLASRGGWGVGGHGGLW